MKSKKLVDPQTLEFLEIYPEITFSDDNITTIRKKMAEMMKAMPSPKLRGVYVQEEFIKAEGFEIRALVYTPENEKNDRPALFHTHGGGFVIGSPEDFDARNQLLCKELGAVIVATSYRLAPENIFPAAIEDSYTVLKWLFKESSSLGVDPNKIAIYGESSGGGLAASLAIMVRDRKELNIRHQFLIYPMLDDRTSVNPNPNPYAGEFVWTNSKNYYGWKSLLGKEPGSEDVSPYAAASRLQEMKGLADTSIFVGALDLFVDENIEYAHRLIRAGIPTELHVYPGGFRGFDSIADADISKQFSLDLIRAMKKGLGIN